MRLPRGYPIYPWGDNEKDYFGTDNDYNLYFDGTNFRIDGPLHEMAINLGTAGVATVYGGASAGDDLQLRANLTNAYPVIFMNGDGDVDLYLPSGVRAFNFYYGATNGGYMLSNATQLEIGAVAGRDINLVTGGAGRISFGTYVAGLVVCTGTIAIKDAAGTATRVLVAQP